MINRFKNSKLFFWTIEILSITILILIISKMKFIVEPIKQFIASIFIPIVISGFFTYLLSPFVKLIKKIKIRKSKNISHIIAVFIVMITFLLIGISTIIVIIPNVINQITKLINSIPGLVSSSQKAVSQVSKIKFIKELGVNTNIVHYKDQLIKLSEQFIQGTATSLSVFVSTMTNITITAITVPVMTFYMLNDGEKLVPAIKKLVPNSREKNIQDIFGRLNQTISRYITGQAIEMIFVFIFTTIGYLMIGQQYALILGLFAGLTNLIPYVGPYIGIIPALFVASFDSVTQVVWTIIVVIIVQQIDGNFIYPKIIGASLKIHPLTIIILLLAAGHISGIFGMIFAIPVYAILRTIIIYTAEFIRLRKKAIDQS